MQYLENKTILIASGPTFAPIDAVRSLTNRSTGRLGSVIAYTLMKRGAKVRFLAGETSLTPALLYPGENMSRIEQESFTTVPQLKECIQRNLSRYPIDAVLMAAAVLDYIPVDVQQGKQRSDRDEWTIRLQRGEKIIESIRQWSPGVFLVGFKLEAQISLDDLTGRAADLMQRSKAGLVVANRVEDIGGEQHVAYLIDQDQASGNYRASSPLLTREAIAEGLADKLEHYFASQPK